ncbi:MAG: hypothetical protein JO345_14770 [Streptosporangiaceae bacterium]|nr:hypothetical protein [Streptosporangiaceae bacterium]
MKLKPSIRLGGRRSRLTAMVAAGTTVLGIASFAVAQAPAHADPTEVYVAVGSDTIQDVMNQYSNDLGGNELGSYNAVNPVSAVAHENITPVEGKHGVSCNFTRPNGSTEGENALRKSINQTTTATQLAAPPQQNCVDIGRSSAAPGSDQKADGQLVFIPFALDAVTGATGPAGTTAITTADSFTLTDLTNLYTNCTTVSEGGVTYNPNTATAGQVQINLYVPQAGSGTLKFWASKLGFSATTLPACVHQTILAGPNAGTQVEEHDGTAVASDPNGYMPFSVAQWISQSNGHDERRHGAVLHNINGVTPCSGGACPSSGGSMNTAFPVTREVYNIVQYDRVVNTGDGNFDQALASLLAGTGSSLCQDVITILNYGFAPLSTPQTTDNCGSTANTLRAFDSTDPV